MVRVRWAAFLPALIFAPLLPAFLAAGVMNLLNQGVFESSTLGFLSFATIYGVFLGVPTYLTFGALGFWLLIKRQGSKPKGFWAVALAAHVISAPFVLAFLWLTGKPDALELSGFVFRWGFVYAPIWGAIFGGLYRGLNRFGARPKTDRD